MFIDKRSLIEDLTGVKSSKLNYYLELKKRNEEIIKQNYRLEIIHQIIKDINIDMSIEDIVQRTYSKLPSVLPCDLLVLALLENNQTLRVKAMVPQNDCLNKTLPQTSMLLQCVKENQHYIYTFDEGESMCEAICGYSGCKRSGITSVLTIPLSVRGKVIGTLLLGAGKKDAYQESELAFCNQLADQLSICIENARLYEEVLRAKREWEETFAAVADPIFLINVSNFEVMRSNNQRLAYMPEQPQGNSSDKKCYQLLWGRNEKCHQCLLEEVIRTGKAAHRERQINGYTLDVHYYPVYNSKQEIYAVIHHIQDKTEKVKMEAQLIHTAKLAAIGEMAAGVAHELNSPLTVIIGTAQMLQRTTNSDLSLDCLRDIENCGLRSKRIIQDLLTFSRQDQRPMALIDINTQVEKALGLVRYQINRNNIAIKTELAADLPPVLANDRQLQQVLINFLLNARDALESVEREKQIVVRTLLGERDGERQIWVEVIDNGEGIEEHNLPKIFNPFFTSKEANKGTGLGLSVSFGIAQAHGGNIEVESVYGQGSKFRLVLPLQE